MTAEGAARLLLLLSASVPLASRAGQVVINEISDKGTEGVCGGEDWVELYNIPDGNANVVNLGGYVLHDDNWPDDEDAFLFPFQGNLSDISPGQYHVLCTGGTDPSVSPQFRIGGVDAITLRTSRDGGVVSTVGPLPDLGQFDVTYIRLPNGTYAYTARPTPGAANVHDPPDPPAPPETAEERKRRLAERNALGERFFGTGAGGIPVSDRFEDILDLMIEMEAADFDYIMENPGYKVYRPFQSAKVLRRSNGTELASFTSPGRIRPKGRYTLISTVCRGIATIPFSLDFDNVDKNQTLFGASRVYLRNKYSDKSHMREWAQHRILARFGLPYLRARKVRFFVNGGLIGLYDLMEAPDHEYVFARSFPDYDPENFALYKVKNWAKECGKKEKYFTPERLAEAAARVNDTSTPPYAWERGEHRKKIPVYGEDGGSCSDAVWGSLDEEAILDIIVAYLRHNEDCGKTVVEVGLLDRDLGVKSWDDAMSTFYNKHLIFTECSAPGCPDSDLASVVDTTNFLKSLAFYAVMLSFDGPLTKGKNLYLAQSGDSRGWKMVPWDMDGGVKASTSCDDECRSRMVHWSILRPTCENVEKTLFAGPLLSDPLLLSRYAKYVRELSTILADDSFMQELVDHANAIQQDAESDKFVQRSEHDYSEELSPDAGEWDSEHRPFLPTLAARTKDIIAQLDALDSCSDAYRPPENVADDEKCMDWRKDSSSVTNGGNTDSSSNNDRCDDNTPCSDGSCCSQYDWCGDSAEYCSVDENCKSNCWGPQRRRTAQCLLVNITELPTVSPQGPTAPPISPTAVPQSQSPSPSLTAAPQSPTEVPAYGVDSAEPSVAPVDPTLAPQSPTAAPQNSTEAPAQGAVQGNNSDTASPTTPPSKSPTIINNTDSLNSNATIGNGTTSGQEYQERSTNSTNTTADSLAEPSPEDSTDLEAARSTDISKSTCHGLSLAKGLVVGIMFVGVVFF